MPYSVETIPAEFPLNYVIGPILRDQEGNRIEPTHDLILTNGLWVKERWTGWWDGVGEDPFKNRRNPDGSIADYWQLCCFHQDCDDWKGSVLTGQELLNLLKDGRIVGYRDPRTKWVITV